MNFKRIIQYNHLRSQLSEQELATADALRDASESDRQLIVESLSPQKASARKSTKKRSNKSERASGMAAQLNRSLVQQREATTRNSNDADDGPLCDTCGHGEQYVDHFQPSPNYHEFDAGKSSARSAGDPSSPTTTSPAPASGTRRTVSSSKSVQPSEEISNASSSTASIETGRGAAGSAASAGGD